jgi:hypothetical protein
VYKQEASPDAPLLLSFVAPVNEIERWASVQGYIDETGHGFQRALDPTRRDEIAAFFDEPQNCSPTAVSIALREGTPCWLEPSVEINDRQHLIGGGATLHIEMEQELVELSGLSDEQHEEERLSHVEELRDRVLEFLRRSGINVEAEAAGLEDDDGSLGDVDEDTLGDDDDEDDEEGDDAYVDDGTESTEQLDVSTSRLGLIVKGLADDGWVTTNWSSLVDLLRPGVVIDGQHRLAGCLKARPVMPFGITAIFEANLEQQIIQFVVINVRQRKLNPRFTSGVFASYMDREHMEEVAEETGLDMTGPQIFSIMNNDPASPFLELIDDSERGSPSKLGYVTMVGIGKEWLKRRPRVLKQKYRAFRKLPGETQAEFAARRQREWEQERCWELCFMFWDAVKDKYPDLWADLGTRTLPRNYFRQAVVLEQLQAAFLDYWETQVFKFPRGGSDDDRFALVISHMKDTLTEFLKNLPADVFAVPWTHGTSLNDSKGRSMLKAFFTYSWRRQPSFKRKEPATQEPRWRSLQPVGDQRIKPE